MSRDAQWSIFRLAWGQVCSCVDSHFGNRGQSTLVGAQRANVPERSRESILVTRGSAVEAPCASLPHAAQSCAVGLHGGGILSGSATALRGVLGHDARNATRANLDSDHAVSTVILATTQAIARGARRVGTAGVTSAPLRVEHEPRLATDAPHELELTLADTARLVLSALISDLDFESALNGDDVATGAATVEVAIAFGHDGECLSCPS